ncbi:MAG TPA: PD-(D/E)XK nuclease family protein [Candidatus Paceibacterota bacterium]|nr:PD-(D/E)XK nuclease family protein [Candidatus Paceibacterota bacterium]
MSQYYKPDRNAAWNYGGKNFRLSRSKIGLFQECPRCFYIDNKLGTGRPPGYPFSLNSAVDALLKKEFDIHRNGKTSHPLMEQYGINAVPFQHPKMDIWRETFKGIEHRHEPTGFVVCGAVDDVWVNPNEELIIVDYKSTSKDEKIEELNKDWHDGYKRQMEVYQWLFRQNGFAVSDTGYFVYANADKDKKAFDGILEFDVTLVPHKGSDAWVEPTLFKIKECLESEKLPSVGDGCDYCIYRETVGKKLQAFMPKKSPIKVKSMPKGTQAALDF